MSTEEFDPRSADVKNEILDEDPLAELARIVAGETESDFVEAPEADASAVRSDESLEAHLMQELSAEQDAPEVPEPADDFTASIQEQLEAQLAADTAAAPEAIPEMEQAIEAPNFEEALSESLVEEEIAPIAAQVAEAAPLEQAINEEVAFQDDLIEALQEEINPVEPVVEPAIEMVEVEPAPISTEITEEIVETVSEEPVLEEALADLPEIELPELEEVETEIMAAELPKPEQLEVVPQEIDLPPPVEPIMAQPEMAQSEIAIEEPAAEIDFGAAFAEELGVETVEEAKGWTDSVEQQPVDDFTLSAQSAGYQPVEEPSSIDGEYLTEPEAELAALDASETETSGGGLKYAMAALVIALFAGAITAGYGFLGGSDGEEVAQEASIIKADVDPVKVKPENPGGRVPDNQDKASYGKVEGIEEQVDQSTLLSNTEQPALIDTSNATQEAIDQAQASLASSGTNDNKSDDRLQVGGETDNALIGANSSVAAKRVKTLIIKPDGTIVDQPATGQSLGNQEFAASSSTLGLTRVPDATPTRVSTTTVKANEPIDGAKSSQDIGVPNASPLPKPKVVAAAPKPKPVAKKKPAPKPQPVARSEWVVQVASQTSAAAAQQSFQKMRSQFSALQNRAMSVQRAAVNGRTYFRVRVQTASRNDANQLCSRLTSQGGSCFVTR